MLAVVGCRRGSPEATPDATPEATPEIQAIGEFQLVGDVQHAFLGVGSGVDPSIRAQSQTTPQTPEGFGPPPDVGVMRVQLETFNEELRDQCGADPEDRINVFWTLATDFSPLLLRGQLEQTLDGRTVGVIGSVFHGPATPADVGGALTEESPAASPSPTPQVSARCILVADQIGTERLPAPRATARPTVAPSPTPMPTAPPAPTPTPTPEETSTATPEVSPTGSPP